MDRAQAIRETLVFLDSVRGLYPAGIPKHAMDARPDAAKLACSIHIIARLTDAGCAILEAARAQGLKIAPEAMQVSDIPAGTLENRAQLRAFVEARLAAVQSRVAVLLGEEFEALTSGMKKDDAGFLLWSGTRVLVSESLSDIAAHPASKKKFWAVLKKTIPLIA